MAMLDFATQKSVAQVLTATANSTDYSDMLAAVDMGAGFAGRAFAAGLYVSAVSGTAPTLAAVLVGADDAAFTVNKITVAALNNGVALAPPVAGTTYRVKIAPHVAKRYYRWEYTVGGTTPSITVTDLGFYLDEQTTVPLV